MRGLLLRATSWTVLGLAAGMPKLRTRFGIPRPLALAAVAAGVPASSVALPPGRWRPYGVFMAQMWAYLRAFELTYAHPERLRRRLRVEEPIRADRFMCAGRTPTERLQAWRSRSPRKHRVDRMLGVVYFAWAPERHAVLLWIARRHPERLTRAATLVGASFNASWLLFSAVPVAPPWWAAKVGRLEGVHRVTVDASRRLPLVPNQSERDDDQGNPWASTPSQHAASAAMLALVASEINRAAGAATWTYAAALGLALIYLGEHYLVDVLSGIALAVAIHRLETPVRRQLC